MVELNLNKNAGRIRKRCVSKLISILHSCFANCDHFIYQQIGCGVGNGVFRNQNLWEGGQGPKHLKKYKKFFLKIQLFEGIPTIHSRVRVRVRV